VRKVGTVGTISLQHGTPWRGGIMHRKWILIATLIVLAAMEVQAQQRNVQSATTRLGWPPVPTAKFIASTEKTFDKLMADAMNVMHERMHSAPYTGEFDRDFLTLMIPHHQGAIDMAKALLLYSKDPQVRRLAQEIITDQQSEIQLMQLWLKQHGVRSQDLTQRPGPDASKH
jgi:uncharacterized protein (DUF305 family)